MVTDKITNNIANLNRLLDKKNELADFCIQELLISKNTKQASKLVDRFHLNIKNYPKLIGYLEENTINFFLRNNEGQRMALWQVEDLCINPVNEIEGECPQPIVLKLIEMLISKCKTVFVNFNS